MTPPICCTGVPVTLPDGRLQYKCGHVYRIVFQLVEQPAPSAKKPVGNVKVAKEVAA